MPIASIPPMVLPKLKFGCFIGGFPASPLLFQLIIWEELAKER
jgi:hypothetical protein